VVARTQPGLAGDLRMVRRMVIPIFRAAHIGIDHGAIDIGVKAASVGGPFAEALAAILVRRIFQRQLQVLALLPTSVARFDSGLA
jgi:hypothetical protein